MDSFVEVKAFTPTRPASTKMSFLYKIEEIIKSVVWDGFLCREKACMPTRPTSIKM